MLLEIEKMMCESKVNGSEMKLKTDELVVSEAPEESRKSSRRSIGVIFRPQEEQDASDVAEDEEDIE